MNEPFGFIEEIIIFSLYFSLSLALSNKLKIQSIAYFKQINWPQKCLENSKNVQNNLIEMTIIQLFIYFSIWLFSCQQLTFIKMKIYFCVDRSLRSWEPLWTGVYFCFYYKYYRKKIFFCFYSLIKYVFDKSFILFFTSYRLGMLWVARWYIWMRLHRRIWVK